MAIGGKETARQEVKKAQESAQRAYAEGEKNKQRLINAIGQYGKGNIDLYNRPQYMNNDGSVSTVRSMGFNDGDNEVLVPTVANINGTPQMLSDNQAIDRYYNTGEYLGKFNSIADSNNYAEALHRQQQLLYGQPNDSGVAAKSYYLQALANALSKR